MANALTTPVRDTNRERPLTQIDDNKPPRVTNDNLLSKQAVSSAAHNRPSKPAPKEGGAEKKRKKPKPSSLCLTPPSLIQGGVGQSYHRGLCIGEGGFARCFQVKNGDGEVFAAKTIAKEALRNVKTKDKLITEIDIHRSMSHPNIVRFIDCFEDDVNVYMLLEMCNNRSLADLCYRRRHLSEPEARYYFMQILGAIGYMHSNGVVHRDLKLGNIFIDKNMCLKVGDFGLAAILETRTSRRYTVCGTPNYISPEVLHRPHAHDTATDIWALGIILYAMLVGRPPFQDRDVEKIYERIRTHQPCFPPAPSSSYQDAWSAVSPDARKLITQMLDPNPMHRPTFSQCLESEWLKTGIFVRSLPLSSLNDAVYLFATEEESKQNFKKVMVEAQLDKLRMNERHYRPGFKALSTSAATASDSVNVVAAANSGSRGASSRISTGKILPHHISPPSTKDKYTQVVVAEDPKPARQNVPDYDSPVVGRGLKARGVDANNNSPGFGRQQRLDGQYKGIDSKNGTRKTASVASAFINRMKFPVAARTSTEAATAAGSIQPTTAATTTTHATTNAIAGTNGIAAIRPSSNGIAPQLLKRPSTTTYKNMIGPLRASIRQTLQTIKTEIDIPVPEDIPSTLVDHVAPPVVLTRWADFDESWGMAYCLSDGSVGTLFRDNTSMRMDPVFNTFVYFESRSKPGYMAIHRTPEDTSDPKRAKKVNVLNYVRQYMDRELAHAIDPVRRGGDVSSGEVLHYMYKGRDFVMFVFTDGTLQFNFKDHYKVIVYDNGNKVGIITDSHQLFSWSISHAIRATRAPHFQRVDLVAKLRSITEALISYSKVI